VFALSGAAGELALMPSACGTRIGCGEMSLQDLGFAQINESDERDGDDSWAKARRDEVLQQSTLFMIRQGPLTSWYFSCDGLVRVHAGGIIAGRPPGPLRCVYSAAVQRQGIESPPQKNICRNLVATALRLLVTFPARNTPLRSRYMEIELR
jgi:hypothetical protein